MRDPWGEQQVSRAKAGLERPSVGSATANSWEYKGKRAPLGGTWLCYNGGEGMCADPQGALLGSPGIFWM